MFRVLIAEFASPGLQFRMHDFNMLHFFSNANNLRSAPRIPVEIMMNLLQRSFQSSLLVGAHILVIYLINRI